VKVDAHSQEALLTLAVSEVVIKLSSAVDEWSAAHESHADSEYVDLYSPTLHAVQTASSALNANPMAHTHDKPASVVGSATRLLKHEQSSNVALPASLVVE
jgi:hypothetical protein